MLDVKAYLFAAILIAGSFTLAGHAFAVDESAMDKAELAQLSPDLRAKVSSHLVDGQTVHGVLETMLLNNLSYDFAAQRIVATDFERGEVVAEGPNGQVRAFPFDVTTLQIRR